MKQIQLDGFFYAGAIQGGPGDVVQVTDANREAAERLVKDRGARVLRNGVEKVSAATPEAGSNGDNDDDGEGLADGPNNDDSVDVLTGYKVGARYVQALKDAGLLLIGDVDANRETLSEIPGISPKAAAAILAAID